MLEARHSKNMPTFTLHSTRLQCNKNQNEKLLGDIAMQVTFARHAQHPNQCSSHLSQCFTPKHYSLLKPSNPQHK